jgi:hypothetical protein
MLQYLLLLLFTAIEFSLGGNGPYTSTVKTNKNKYTIPKHSTTIKKTVYSSTYITKIPIQLSKHPPHTHTHTLQNKFKQPQ